MVDPENAARDLEDGKRKSMQGGKVCTVSSTLNGTLSNADATTTSRTTP